MTDTPAPPVPDDKDWTWVLDEVCPDCGFDTAAVDVGSVGELVRANASAWQRVLARGNVRERPAPQVWSPLEYACHVRDVFRIFLVRLDRMLAEDGPRFANWDQDATALEERYDLAEPAAVAAELTTAGAALADRFDSVTGEQWDRSGFRSDGATFTVASLARYFIHDPVHHLWDVAPAR